MADMRLQFILQMVDEISAPGRRALESVRGVTSGISGAWRQATAGVNSLTGGIAQLGVAVGAGLEVRTIVADEDVFNRLRVQYNMTEAGAEALHATVMAAALREKTAISEVIAALQGFKEAGGDVPIFGKHADTAAATVQLLGGMGTEVGKMLAALDKQFHIEGPQEMLRAVAALYEQTKTVPGGFGTLAGQVNALAATYANLGHSGTEAARELGAAYAVVAEGTKGTGRQAYAEVENVLKLVGSLAGRDMLQSIGVQVTANMADYYDVTKSLPITDIMAQIAKAFVADPVNVGMQLQRTPGLLEDLKTLTGDIARTGHPVTLETKMAVTGDPVKFMRDATEAAKSLQASLSFIQSTLLSKGEMFLATPFRWLAEAMAAAPGPITALVTVLAGLLVVGAVGRWVAYATTGLFRFAFALAALSAPAWIAIGAVTALAVGAYLIYQHWTPIKEFFGGAVPAALAVASGAFAILGVAMMATPFGWVLAGVAGVAAALTGLYELYKHWEEIKGAFTAPASPEAAGITYYREGELVPPSAAPASPLPRASLPKLPLPGLPTFPTIAAPDIGVPELPALPVLRDLIPDFVRRGFHWTVRHIVPSAVPEREERPEAPEREAPFGGALEGGEVRHKVGGEISVRFENAPPGTRAKITRHEGPVDLDLSMGQAMWAPG